MATLQELMAQREALERQIEQTKKQERGEAIEKVRALMAEYGLTVADLGSRKSGKAKKSKSSGNKVAAKYRNASTGETWSGRGPAAALAEGGARERPQAQRLRGLDGGPACRRCCGSPAASENGWTSRMRRPWRGARRLASIRDPARLHPGPALARRHRRGGRPLMSS